MLSFIPVDKDIFLRGNTPEQYQRLIFADQELTNKEQEHWNGFLEYCKTNNLEIQDIFTNRERKSLRFL